MYNRLQLRARPIAGYADLAPAAIISGLATVAIVFWADNGCAHIQGHLN
jgi:hypothetical protein